MNPTTQTVLLALNPALTVGGILLAVGVFKGSVGQQIKEHERRLDKHDDQIDDVQSDVSEIRGELKLGVSR